MDPENTGIDEYEAAEFALAELSLLAIGAYLLLKAALFRRGTVVGRRLALNNVVIGLAYISLAAAPWVPFFRSDYWLIPVRVVVLITTHLAASAMIRSLGGCRHLALVLLGWLRDRPQAVRQWSIMHRGGAAMYIGGGVLLVILIILLLIWVL